MLSKRALLAGMAATGFGLRPPTDRRWRKTIRRAP